MLFFKAIHAECGSKHSTGQHPLLGFCPVHDVWELLLLQHRLPVRAGIHPGVCPEVCVFWDGFYPTIYFIKLQQI